MHLRTNGNSKKAVLLKVLHQWQTFSPPLKSAFAKMLSTNVFLSYLIHSNVLKAQLIAIESIG